MPIEVRKPRKSTANPDLKRRLIEEWKGTGTEEPRPHIIHQEDDHGVVVHVYVIWDDWRALNQEERSELITDAYWEAYPEEGMALTVAMGLTPDEGRRMHLIS